MPVKFDDTKFRNRINKLKNNISKDDNTLKGIASILIGDNQKAFTDEGYYNENFVFKKWKPFKPSTLYYIRKRDGVKVWRKRPSGKRYSPQSKLLLDTGRLRASIGSISREGLLIVKRHRLTYGSQVKYARYQNSMRPILGFSSKAFDLAKRYYKKSVLRGV